MPETRGNFAVKFMEMKSLLGLFLLLVAGLGIGWMFAHPEQAAWYLWAGSFALIGFGGGMVGTSPVFKKKNSRT